MQKTASSTVSDYLREGLPLDVIGQVIARTTPERFIGYYEASRKGTK